MKRTVTMIGLGMLCAAFTNGCVSQKELDAFLIKNSKFDRIVVRFNEGAKIHCVDGKNYLYIITNKKYYYDDGLFKNSASGIEVSLEGCRLM